MRELPSMRLGARRDADPSIGLLRPATSVGRSGRSSQTLDRCFLKTATAAQGRAQSRKGARSAARRTRDQPVTRQRHHRNPPRLHLPALRRTDDRHRDPHALRPDPRTADAPGSDMNSTVPRPACQTLAPRQRGPRADICACRFAKRYDRPLHHRKCTTTPLRYGVSAPPAARLTVPHPTPLTIRAYQSP